MPAYFLLSLREGTTKQSPNLHILVNWDCCAALAMNRVLCSQWRKYATVRRLMRSVSTDY